MLLEYYRQAAKVIGSMINQHKFPMNRTIALSRHRWYAMLDPYDALDDYFSDSFELSPLEIEWLKERALSRNEFIIFSEYSPKELFLNDVMDILDYYNHPWKWNPPKGYIIPETFYL
jgi:hypothetical protein